MKITHITITNVLGIRSADLPITTPVTLFGAKNGSGKTSVAEAVRMALAGDPVARGVALKKDLQALVHDGQKTGTAEVTVDGTTAYVMLPSGKTTPLDEWTVPPALPYVLEAQRFTQLTPTERRAFLFGLMGLRITPDAVMERLVKRGVDAVKAAEVKPLLRAGFADASEAAKRKATEAKGAWRVVTGETYGSVKAVTWAADKPSVDTAELSKVAERITGLDSEIADANQQLGQLKGAQQQAQRRGTRITELETLIEGKERAAAKLVTDEAGLVEAQANVDKAQGSDATVKGMPCPCCKAMLMLSGGALVEAPPAGTPNPLAEKLGEFTKARDLMKRSVDNSKQAVAAIAAGEVELKSLQGEAAEAPTASDIDAATLVLNDLQGQRSTAVALQQKLQKDATAAADADVATKKAAGHHADVVAWDAIATALAPDGIPGEMLNEALEPFNQRLAQTATDTEWGATCINADMSVTCAGRSFNLLSESEQWRVNAMVAEAVSYLSKLKLMVLDRFDVLDLKGRNDLLAWLEVLASTGEVDTALVFGTLKAPPAQLPAGCSSVWIEAGVAQLPQEQLAA